MTKIACRILTAFLPLACMGCAGIKTDSADRYLPPYWIEQEGTYQGVWTRRPHTTIYDAQWTRGAETVTDVIEFQWVHKDVISFHRAQIDGQYIGFLSEDDNALVITRGAMSWSSGTWHAKAADGLDGLSGQHRPAARTPHIGETDADHIHRRVPRGR